MPKQLCRSLRFKHVFKRLSASKVESNAELALACGYYDQSHLIKDFKYYTGKSPTAFFRTQEAGATFFSENF